MNDLIRITNNEQGSSVIASARDLYDFLGFNKAAFAQWAKKNIETNSLALEGEGWEGFNIMLNGNPNTKEGEDWVFFDIKSKNTERSRPTVDYRLTLDFAKRLSMLARTGIGKFTTLSHTWNNE